MRIAEQSNDVDKIIILSKYLFKISKYFDNAILDFGLEECNQETNEPPKGSEKDIT